MATASNPDMQTLAYEIKIYPEIFCENRQNLVKQRITPHFQTTDHPITTNLLPGDEL
jgi:hypothetical protein